MKFWYFVIYCIVKKDAYVQKPSINAYADLSTWGYIFFVRVFIYIRILFMRAGKAFVNLLIWTGVRVWAFVVPNLHGWKFFLN